MTLVIFDVDGTLVYSNKIDSQCFADTYQLMYGLPFPTIDWTKYPHVTDDTIFKTVIQDHFQRLATQEEIASFKQAFTQNIHLKRQTAPEEFKMVPGAKNAIERLVANNSFAVGIATGGWKAPAILKLEFVEIATVDLLVSGADGKETREQIIEEVLQQASEKKLPIKRVVYVGDAIWDVKTTRNMGLPLIGLRRRGDTDFLHQLGVRHVLSNFTNYDLFVESVANAEPPLSL